MDCKRNLDRFWFGIRIASQNPMFRSLAALGALTGISFILWFIRLVVSWRIDYLFLPWNLFLAWVPVCCAAGVGRLDVDRLKAPVWILAFCWILFLPNAPYLLTDLIHLRPRGTALYWFDLLLFVSFAWTGLLLGFISLLWMQERVASRLGSPAGWIFSMVSLGLCSFGIYLGRFLRWNSWDLLISPKSLIEDVWRCLANPIGDPGVWGFTLGWALFLLGGYVVIFTLTGMRSPSRSTLTEE